MAKTNQNGQEQEQVQLDQHQQAQPAFAQEQVQEQAQAQAQPLLAQEQEQEQAQEQEQEQQAGQMMAANIAMQLPAAGAVPPAPAQEAAPAPQLAAPRTKAERKMARRREELLREAEERRQQEEARLAEERRQQEEAQRAEAARLAAEQRAEELRRVKAEDKRIEMENRRKRRDLIFNSADMQKQLAAFLNTPAEEQTVDMAEQLLRSIGNHLLNSDAELKAGHGGASTVCYTDSMIVPLKMVISTQIEEQAMMDSLMTRARELEARDAELAQERVLVSLLSHDMIPSILDAEVANSPILKTAAVKIASQFDLRLSGFLKVLNGLEGVVARNLHLSPNEVTQEASVLGSGSAYHSFARGEAVEAFKTQVDELMETEHLDRVQAETQVLNTMRAEQQAKNARARKLTRDGAVVPNVPEELVKKYGCASYSQILPEAQAAEIVKQSNGFLYAVPVPGEAGLCRLKATLPETVTIKGEKIPLRRNYTLLVKAMMQGVMDKHGALKEDADEFASEAVYCLSDASAATSNVKNQTITYLDNFLSKYIRPGLMESLGNEDAVAATTDQLRTLITAFSASGSFIPKEILGNFSSAIQRIQAAGADAAAGNAAPLAARQEQMRQAFLTENNGAPLTEAQEAQINALSSLYADLDTAMVEMLDIRNMDADSPDVPLPNACSAHATFIHHLRKDFLGQEFTGALEYSTSDQIAAAPLDYVDHCIKHFPELSNQDSLSLQELKAMRDRLAAARDAGQPLTVTNEEIEQLRLLAIKKHANSHATTKYEYHQAANLGQMEDGTFITSEGFAAEEKQYIVTPFSRKHAVGLYRGGKRAADSEYTKSILAAKQNLLQQEKQLNKLTKEVDQLTKETNELTQQLDQLSQHRFTKKQERAQLEAKLAAAKAKLADKTEQKNSANFAILKKREQIRNSDDRLARLNGMTAYYNHDKPLPTDEDILLADLKEKLAENALPGAQPN